MTASEHGGGAVAAPPPVLAPDSDKNFINHSAGLLSWALTLDHKRIGIMYGTAITIAFAVGGFFALLVRTELFSPDPILTDNPNFYNSWFTLHGAIMVFLVIVPGIPAALGNFVLPILLGAKDVAFPRLNLASFYLWLIGAGLLLGALLNGGLDTGWTFYAPYSLNPHYSNSVLWALSGVFVLGFSSIFTGLNFMVTIHKLRPHGMTWFRMPLFLWAIYSTAIMQVMATPILAITLLLLMMEKSFGIGIFDPALGGDPVLMQHFFWFYSHPAVYIMIVPAMGVISDLIAVHSHREIFGYRYIAFSSVAIALFSFIVWGHHMFTSMSPLLNAIFSGLTYSVSIPSAVKVFNWLATLYRGSIALNAPMLYALGFIFIFTIGGVTGLFLATLAVDIHLHDSYFVVAHFHYVMMGSAILAFFAGLHHWWPKIWGKMYNEKLALVAFSLVFVGFNATFLPQFVIGSKGMARRYYTYDLDFQWGHQFSTIGAYTMALGFVIMAFYLVMSVINGKKAPRNPWGGNSLEWHCQSPPIHENFKETPVVGNPYDFSGWEWSESEQGYVPRQMSTA